MNDVKDKDAKQHWKNNVLNEPVSPQPTNNRSRPVSLRNELCFSGKQNHIENLHVLV